MAGDVVWAKYRGEHHKHYPWWLAKVVQGAPMTTSSSCTTRRANQTTRRAESKVEGPDWRLGVKPTLVAGELKGSRGEDGGVAQGAQSGEGGAMSTSNPPAPPAPLVAGAPPRRRRPWVRPLRRPHLLRRPQWRRLRPCTWTARLRQAPVGGAETVADDDEIPDDAEALQHQGFKLTPKEKGDLELFEQTLPQLHVLLQTSRVTLLVDVAFYAKLVRAIKDVCGDRQLDSVQTKLFEEILDKAPFVLDLLKKRQPAL